MRFSHFARCFAACSLLVAACADSPVADPGTEPAPNDTTDVDPTPPPTDDVTPASEAVATQVSAYWSAQRTPDQNFIEFAEFHFDGDAIPVDVAHMSWNPQIRVSLTVQRLSCSTELQNTRFDIIEPQLATLVSRVGDDITVQLADGTQVQVSKTWFAMTNASPERLAMASQLTSWPELVCGYSGEDYAMAVPASYVIASLPASVFDTLDVATVHQTYGDEKKLVVGPATVSCLKSTTTNCTFSVSTPDIVAVADDSLTFRTKASGAGLNEITEALAMSNGTVVGVNTNVAMACASGACEFTWAQPRTAP